MRRKLPPLAALRAFEAAARHMSFREAALELGVTPTAISHQIRQLEMACDVLLFRRRPRPLALTEAGKHLFPVLRAGFDSFVAAASQIGAIEQFRPLRITATNALAHRWLVPRLPNWRRTHPGLPLEVIGTDTVLAVGEADVALRYARTAPPGVVAHELMRDTFWPMCNPLLLGSQDRPEGPADILRYPLIHAAWGESEPPPPTWFQWFDIACRVGPDLRPLAVREDMVFREELHAIEAMIAGQGVAICSDLLLAEELANGTIMRASNVSLPGFGVFLCYQPAHVRLEAIEAFAAWARVAAIN